LLYFLVSSADHQVAGVGDGSMVIKSSVDVIDSSLVGEFLGA